MNNWLNEKAVNEVMSCEDERGIISTESVLEQAKSEDSSLHGYFEWDESRAAQEYNLIQARQLIRKVPVQYQGDKKQSMPRLIHVKSVGGGTKSGYKRIETLTLDEREEAVREAIKRIRYWQKVYANYEEVSGFIDNEEVSRVEEEVLTFV